MMKSTRWALGAAVLASVSLSGCHKRNVQTVRNVERAVARWEESQVGVPHMCLEYSTAAEKLHDREAGATVPVGEAAVTLSYKDKEALATIYSVSENMQFGHAALYRLCEASGNRVIADQAYEELFSTTIDKVHGLIELQLLREKLNSIEHLVVLETQLKELDSERCRLSASESAGAARQLLELNLRRKSLVEDIERLQGLLGAKVTHLLPTDSVPTAAEWKEIRTHADAILVERDKITGATLLDRRALARSLLAKTPVPKTDEGNAATAWKAACDGLTRSLTKRDGACEAPVELLETCP